VLGTAPGHGAMAECGGADDGRASSRASAERGLELERFRPVLKDAYSQMQRRESGRAERLMVDSSMVPTGV